MSVTVFGIFWILISLFVFLFTNINSSLFVLLFSMLLQSNVVVFIGGRGIGPQITISLLFLIVFYLKYRSNLVNNKNKAKKNLLLFFLFLVILTITTIINKSMSFHVFSVLLMIIIYYINFYLLYNTKSEFLNGIEIEKILLNILYIIFVVGVLQLLIEYGVINNKEILRTLIYNDINGEVAYNLPRQIKRFYSTFMEPSFASAYLVGMFYYILISKKKFKYKNIILSLLFISLILTKSTTGYIGFVITLFIFLFSNKTTTNTNKIIITYLFILFALLVVILNYNLINDVFVNKLNTQSYVVRNNWNVRGYNTFLENKIIGIGYMQKRSSSLVITMLAESGIIGTLFYFSWVLNLIVLGKKYSTESVYFLIAVIINQFIGSPDLTFSVFWFGLYLLGINNKKGFY